MAVDFHSPYYPYEKVQTGYLTYHGAEKLPLQIAKYLLDLPDANGYWPVDDNDRPRVRLIKYLFYDRQNPLAQPLPSVADKLSILFDPDEPDINTDEQKKKHPNGYRLFPQCYWQTAELDAKTVLKCYVGKVVPYSPFSAHIGLRFEIVVNYGNDVNLKTSAYSRAYAMECALLEALHGVNFNGIGVCNFNRRAHTDAGSNAYHDEGQHIYRIVDMSIDWAQSTDGGENVTTAY